MPCNVRTKKTHKIRISVGREWFMVRKNRPFVSAKLCAHSGINTSGCNPDKRMNLNNTTSPPPTVCPLAARLPFIEIINEKGLEVVVGGGCEGCMPEWN